MKWLKEKGDFLALAGLMVALTSLIIVYIKDFKVDTQKNMAMLQQNMERLQAKTQKDMEILRTDTQRSIEALRADTQRSIEVLQADVREIRTLIITHIVEHHNQSIPAVAQKKLRAKKKPRRVSSTPTPRMPSTPTSKDTSLAQVAKNPSSPSK